MRFKKKKRLTEKQIRYIDDRIHGVPTGFERRNSFDFFGKLKPITKKGELEFKKLVDHIYPLVLEFDNYKITVFETVFQVYGSPILGFLLAIKYLNSREFKYFMARRNPKIFKFS